MIDASSLDCLTFRELAERFRVSSRSLAHWACPGRDGVRLEAVKIGNYRRSTVEAVNRFLRAREAARAGRPAPPGPSEELARLDAELEAMGL